MKEDPLRVFLFDRRPRAQTKCEKREHGSPGVKQHPEDQDDEESNEHIAEFPNIENHDWRVDCLADDG